MARVVGIRIDITQLTATEVAAFLSLDCAARRTIIDKMFATAYLIKVLTGIMIYDELGVFILRVVPPCPLHQHDRHSYAFKGAFLAACGCVSALSWPHAAAISRPIGTRTVATAPCSSSFF